MDDLANKIFYGIMLMICGGVAGGLAIWGMKRYVGQAIDALEKFKVNVQEDMKAMKADIKIMPDKIKESMDKVCTERQQSCFRMVSSEIADLKAHGHRGLTGDANNITINRR